MLDESNNYPICKRCGSDRIREYKTKEGRKQYRCSCGSRKTPIREIKEKPFSPNKFNIAKKNKYPTHLFIPDTQIKPNVDLHHLIACGRLIVDRKPDTIIQIGDFADMESLSSYDQGKKCFEGRSYKNDVFACHQGLSDLFTPLKNYRLKNDDYNPRKVITLGNHEYRINRAVNDDPKLSGLISHKDLKFDEYFDEIYPYQREVVIDGVSYAHNFVNKSSLKKGILAGAIDTKLKNMGYSFSMGHQQTFQYGIRHVNKEIVNHGLVAGAFYLHDESYMGEQGNDHWRGVVLCHNVHNGQYDIETITIESLINKYL